MRTTIVTAILLFAVGQGATPQERDRVPPFRGGAGPGGAPPFLRKMLERIVLTHIRSPAGGEQGIAVGVLPPETPRYEAGAPVVIQVQGGHEAGAPFCQGRLADFGFVEIAFAFPGGGRGSEASGGTYDYRGADSIRALRDVILFATGRTRDNKGRTIQDLAGKVKLLTKNCGLIGGSHGGNACGAVMGLYGQDFPDLAFYVSVESPYGEGAVGVEIGSNRDGQLNPAYDPKTGELDLSKLAYDPSLPVRQMGRREPGRDGDEPLRGALYFDMNGNGQFDRDADYQPQCIAFDVGQGRRAWYSLRLLRETERRKLYGKERPNHIPSVAEAEEFWRYRDAAPLIPDVVKKLPGLAVIVIANETDHVQIAPDHFHILEQVNGFQKAGARLIRLNPDRCYMEWACGRTEARLVDNPAGVAYRREDIHKALQQNDLDAGRIASSAAVCELADRVQAQDFSPNLAKVLFPDAPKGKPIERPGPRPGGPRRGFGERPPLQDNDRAR